MAIEFNDTVDNAEQKEINAISTQPYGTIALFLYFV